MEYINGVNLQSLLENKRIKKRNKVIMIETLTKKQILLYIA